jgi:hypothetical protein
MAEAPTGPAAGEAQFDFEKGNFFRVIWVDGAMGGITPGGQIHMAVYNERAPIPKSVFHAVQPNGQLGPENTGKRVVRTGFFREVEADLMFNYETAVAIRVWLDEKIRLLEEHMKDKPK